MIEWNEVEWNEVEWNEMEWDAGGLRMADMQREGEGEGMVEMKWYIQGGY